MFFIHGSNLNLFCSMSGLSKIQANFQNMMHMIFVHGTWPLWKFQQLQCTIFLKDRSNWTFRLYVQPFPGYGPVWTFQYFGMEFGALITLFSIISRNQHQNHLQAFQLWSIDNERANCAGKFKICTSGFGMGSSFQDNRWIFQIATLGPET